MDDLVTRRTVLLNRLAEIEDNIAIQVAAVREPAIREPAGGNEVFANADTVDPTSSPRGDADNEDDNNNENDNNDIDDGLQISFDFEGGFGGMMVPIFPDGPGSPETMSEDDDVEIVMSTPSKLSLRYAPPVGFMDHPDGDRRFKSDQWLSEKPSESFSRDFLQGIATARLHNTLRPEMFVLMLAHPNAERCPAKEACHHWELRWDDRPRREPGTIELELICLDRRDRGIFVDPPGQRFHLLDKDHPNPITCDPCYLFNGLKPDFSCLDGTNLDLVLFRLLQPDDGEDDNPVEGRDESEGNNLDHPFEKIGCTEARRYMDRCGRALIRQ